MSWIQLTPLGSPKAKPHWAVKALPLVVIFAWSRSLWISNGRRSCSKHLTTVSHYPVLLIPVERGSWESIPFRCSMSASDISSKRCFPATNNLLPPFILLPLAITECNVIFSWARVLLEFVEPTSLWRPKSIHFNQMAGRYCAFTLLLRFSSFYPRTPIFYWIPSLDVSLSIFWFSLNRLLWPSGNKSPGLGVLS